MSHSIVKIGACQTPEIIENPSEALDCMLRFAKEAESKNVDLLLFPECFLTGYILSESYELFYAPGNEYPIFEIKGPKYGINVCYDTQFADAAKAVTDGGAQLLLSPTQNMLRRETAEYWKDKHSEICV